MSLSDNENYSLFLFILLYVFLCMCPCRTLKTVFYLCFFYCMNFCVDGSFFSPCQTTKAMFYFCLFYCMNFCVWVAVFFSPCQTTKTIFVCFIVRLPLFGWQLRVAVGQRKNWVQSQGTEVCPRGRLGHIPPTQHPQEPHQQTQPLQPGNVCGVCVSVCLCACVLMGKGTGCWLGQLWQ